VTHDSGLLVDQLAAGEDSEVRNSANVESSRQWLVLVGVNFQDDSAASHIGGRARDLWCRCPAGTAPFGPEIDKNRNLRALNYLIEELLVHLQWFVDWR
jgi:hypothetical protein